jgi:hypothetical protein
MVLSMYGTYLWGTRDGEEKTDASHVHVSIISPLACERGERFGAQATRLDRDGLGRELAGSEVSEPSVTLPTFTNQILAT